MSDKLENTLSIDTVGIQISRARLKAGVRYLRQSVRQLRRSEKFKSSRYTNLSRAKNDRKRAHGVTR